MKAQIWQVVEHSSAKEPTKFYRTCDNLCAASIMIMPKPSFPPKDLYFSLLRHLCSCLMIYIFLLSALDILLCGSDSHVMCKKTYESINCFILSVQNCIRGHFSCIEIMKDHFSIVFFVRTIGVSLKCSAYLFM